MELEHYLAALRNRGVRLTRSGDRLAAADADPIDDDADRQ